MSDPSPKVRRGFALRRRLAPSFFAALFLATTGQAQTETPAASASEAYADPTSRRASPLPPPAKEGDSWVVPALHGLGVMTGMRIGAAILWPEPFADLSPQRVGRSYADAFTHWPRWDSSEPAFEWDGDRWTINVVGHGLFGSELFMRARICRRSLLEALAFTAVGSVVWEYGVEASAVRPSALDLWYTPVAGMLLGEARYLGYAAASRIRDGGWRSVLSAMLDPLGEFERALGAPC